MLSRKVPAMTKLPKPPSTKMPKLPKPGVMPQPMGPGIQPGGASPMPMPDLSGAPGGGNPISVGKPQMGAFKPKKNGGF